MPQYPEIERITSKFPWYNGGWISTVIHTPSVNAASTLVTATNWPSANLAIYTPVVVPERIVVAKLGWFNGTTVTGNADMGVYDLDGTLIASTGATALSGTSAWQFVDVTDFVLGPGCFYLAISCSSNGRIQFINQSLISAAEAAGQAQQASAHPLPATATFAAISAAGNAIVPVLTAVIDGTL